MYTTVEYGPLPAALRSLCEKKPVDLIVMGSQGAGGLGLFGSNAAAVAKASAVPVLVVPKEARMQTQTRSARTHARTHAPAHGVLVAVHEGQHLRFGGLLHAQLRPQLVRLREALLEPE